MNISFSAVYEDLINFIKHPQYDALSDAFREAPQKVFKYLFALDFILMFVLSILLSMAGVDEMEHEIEQLLDNPFLLAIMAVLVAPILEEAIFRLPMAWLGTYFKLGFWLLTLGFAALHLTNFSSSFPIYLAPVLILPQFILGIIIGYVRVGWGFWYGVLFHALHNGILVGLASLGSFLEVAS